MRTQETSTSFHFANVGLQRLIDPDQTDLTAPIVDWLFEHEHWAIIADAATELPADVLTANTHQGSIIAESMHRLGSAAAAHDLFSRLSTDPDAPFIVHLRHAELAVQIADVEDAERAIAKATKKAGSKRDRHYTQIISAQLAIRRARFDDARQQLESVVHAATADQRLRGRAQWLLGETHFMQRDYRAAIEQYRRCETLFPDSGWAPAALLQAGKAFERLGNFRDAVVCYSSLMNKHKSSSYARIASRRLTSIGVTQNR